MCTLCLRSWAGLPAMREEVDSADLPVSPCFYIISFVAAGYPSYGGAWKTCEPHLAVLLRHMIPESVIDAGLQCKVWNTEGRRVALITRKVKTDEQSTIESVSDR